MTKSINVVFIRQNGNETQGTIYIRTIDNRVIKKKSLKIRVSSIHFQRFFNPQTQRFRNDERFPNYSLYNDRIETSLTELQRHDNNIESLPDNRKSFLRYWKETIGDFDNHGSIIKHETIIHKLEKYLTSINKRDLLFKDITPLFLRGFKSYLGTTNDPKGLSVNTVNHYLKVMKSIINQSIVDEYYSYSKHPFSSLKFSNERVKKNILSESEFTQLLNTEIPNEDINMTRDMFLFQVFSNGMRVSDLFLLRWNHFINGRLDYKMFKTGNDISIPVNINMTIILSKILGLFNMYNEIYTKNTTEFIDEYGINPIRFKSMTIPKLDKLINYVFKFNEIF
jgi:integrase